MSEQPKGPPERRDTPTAPRVLTPMRTLVAAGIFTAVTVGGFLSLKGCDTEQEQVERHGSELKKDVAHLFDELVRTGDLPPGVRPEQLTDEVRALMIEGVCITMEGIFRREELRDPDVRAQYLSSIRTHLLDGMSFIVDQEER
jgi:hypothetical protein